MISRSDLVMPGPPLEGILSPARGSERETSPDAQPAATRGAWIAYTLGALLVENNTIPWLLAQHTVQERLDQAAPPARFQPRMRSP